MSIYNLQAENIIYVNLLLNYKLKNLYYFESFEKKLSKNKIFLNLYKKLSIKKSFTPCYFNVQNHYF